MIQNSALGAWVPSREASGFIELAVGGWRGLVDLGRLRMKQR